MEPYLLHNLLVFIAGLVVGIVGVLIISKIKTGRMTSAAVKEEYQEYQGEVEKHFEETSKKLKDMTEQYQDLYKHLSVGATTLCRPDSVAAVIADKSAEALKLENQAEVGKKPSADNEPLAKKESSVSKESAVKEEHSANKESLTSKESSTSKEPSANEKSSGSEKQTSVDQKQANSSQKANSQKQSPTPEEQATRKLAEKRHEALKQKAEAKQK